ncbi:MAG: alkaline phosphatase D family protein [Acidimicrobiales bacterium]
MRGISRRDFIGTAVAGGAGALLLPRWAAALPNQVPTGPSAIPSAPFTLGVASGDPTPTSVILWTRLAPDPLNDGGMGPGDEAVDWEVATDEGFADVVASGTATASAMYAHSVHVDAGGLEPDSWYWYRFSAGGYDSPVGRTRTLPAAGSSPAAMAFGFASCQSWTSGYYTAHTHLAAEPLDLVFFLGDFIYEGGTGGGVRPHNSAEVTTLPMYRNRYALYGGDAELQKSRAAFPWVVVWDDHEVENNYAGQFDENGSDPATFLVRRAAAYQAWWEHQPVRLAPPTGPDLAIYRGFEWGDLASFSALDTRQYRDDHACPPAPGLGDIGPVCDNLANPDRTILGAAQESWLLDRLGASTSIWNVLANQVVFSAMPFAGAYNFDQWDGYPVTRQRVVDVLARPEVRNPVIITGDIHAAGVADVHQVGEDPTTPRVATELVGTSISSQFNDELVDLAEALIGSLPWARYVNAQERGYVTVALTRDRMDANFRVVSTVTQTSATVSTDFTWSVDAEPLQGPTTTTAPPPTSTTAPSSTAAPAVTASPNFTG